MLNRRMFTMFFAMLLLILATADARTKRKKRFKCQEKVEEAVELYNKGRYNRVKTILDEAKINCSGNPAMEDILYWLGKSQLETKQSSEARISFEIFLSNYPKSSYSDEVRFLIGVCVYDGSNSFERDQTETKKAMREFMEFIQLFPETPFADSARIFVKKCEEKLIKKELMNARFYEKIDRYESAVVYYRYILEHFSESGYIPVCKLNLARNLLETGNQSEAEEVLHSITESEADKEIVDKARQLLSRISGSQKNKNQIKTPENDQKK